MGFIEKKFDLDETNLHDVFFEYNYVLKTKYRREDYMIRKNMSIFSNDKLLEKYTAEQNRLYNLAKELGGTEEQLDKIQRATLDSWIDISELIY